jgi:transcription elongation factor Elf1
VAESDSIADRAHRVRTSLEPYGDPQTVKAAVDGLCPECGDRFVVDVRSDLGRITCPACGAAFTI